MTASLRGVTVVGCVLHYKSVQSVTRPVTTYSAARLNYWLEGADTHRWTAGIRANAYELPGNETHGGSLL